MNTKSMNYFIANTVCSFAHAVRGNRQEPHCPDEFYLEWHQNMREHARKLDMEKDFLLWVTKHLGMTIEEYLTQPPVKHA